MSCFAMKISRQLYLMYTGPYARVAQIFGPRPIGILTVKLLLASTLLSLTVLMS